MPETGLEEMPAKPALDLRKVVSDLHGGEEEVVQRANIIYNFGSRSFRGY